MADPIWITEQEVVDLMSLPQAIVALRNGLRQEASGLAANMVKTHAVWNGNSTLHAIGAVIPGAGIVGTKTWAHTPNGAMPLLVLIDARDGAVLAVIEAFALGQMRTGGISGVAADILARRDAKRMAMIGAGKQSLPQIAAVHAVRPLESLAVWSPTEANREALAKAAADVLGIHAFAASALEDALEGSDIVTLATRATEPFLFRDMLKPGTHLNAVGAILPDRIEFAIDLLERADLIAADSVPQIRKHSREFTDAFGTDETAWQRVKPLSELVAANKTRPDGADLTVFKAMGMGISDLSLGAVLLESAREAGIGRSIPKPMRAKPRMTDTSN